MIGANLSEDLSAEGALGESIELLDLFNCVFLNLLCEFYK